MTDKAATSWLLLVLFKAFKISLTVRDVTGYYTSVSDMEEWRLANSSTLVFRPSLIITPGRAARSLGANPKQDFAPEKVIDMAMPVPDKFLLTELWYVNHMGKNHIFKDILEHILATPTYTNVAMVNRLVSNNWVDPSPICACEGYWKSGGLENSTKIHPNYAMDIWERTWWSSKFKVEPSTSIQIYHWRAMNWPKVTSKAVQTLEVARSISKDCRVTFSSTVECVEDETSYQQTRDLDKEGTLHPRYESQGDINFMSRERWEIYMIQHHQGHWNEQDNMPLWRYPMKQANHVLLTISPLITEDFWLWFSQWSQCFQHIC